MSDAQSLNTTKTISVQIKNTHIVEILIRPIGTELAVYIGKYDLGGM